MALYESWHGLNPEYFKVETGENLSYPPHIHYCFEVVAVLEGELNILADGVNTVIKEGQMAVIFPNRLHSFRTEKSSRHKLIIFSTDMVGHFTNKVGNKIPDTILFSSVPKELFKLFADIEQSNNVFKVKGILYAALGMFSDEVKFTEGEEQPKHLSLLYTMLDFIEKNCYGDCSLKALSENIKYDYTYLSKFFKQNIGFSYNEYVNMIKISHASYLLKTTELSVVEISNRCGYDSLRTFNRNFKKYTGDIPKDYKLLNASDEELELNKKGIYKEI